MARSEPSRRFRRNRDCVNGGSGFVKDNPVHLALRELRAAYTDPIALAAMIGVGVIAGITGPFSTFDYLAPGPRLVYWMTIALGTYGVGLIGANLAQSVLLPGGGPLVLRIAILGLGASVPVTAFVVAASWLFFPDIRSTGLGIAELYLYCLLISLALMAVIEGVVAPQMKKHTMAPHTLQAAAGPPILRRLPHAVRGRLSHMSMADHYVEVFTDKGSALVLMRMADAIAETQPVAGMQIHRSHWVASDVVTGVRRTEGRVVVELASGEILPVSRSQLKAVREKFAP